MVRVFFYLAIAASVTVSEVAAETAWRSDVGTHAGVEARKSLGVALEAHFAADEDRVSMPVSAASADENEILGNDGQPRKSAGNAASFITTAKPIASNVIVALLTGLIASEWHVVTKTLDHLVDHLLR